jgi:hypothetical protein
MDMVTMKDTTVLRVRETGCPWHTNMSE